MLVDITVVGIHDFKTGVQRATRSLLRQFCAEPPAGYRIEPVYRSENCYCYARRDAGPVIVSRETFFLVLIWTPAWMSPPGTGCGSNPKTA